ncbi:tail fiber protein [Cellulophaga phage phi10:1]|uniref:Structural protein n=1 Tax=Cellulophaga phage phi10:1 TaxID=1327981 RepID=R9ZYK6_9CAUD|nr:tail fiber protein [Cellulophaga phage phi10:1]AGO48434.1 structural protein [Cellulophaga phage phi10:1]
MKHTISIVLFFILSLGLNAQTVEGTVGSDGSLIPYNVSGGLDETAVDTKINTAIDALPPLVSTIKLATGNIYEPYEVLLVDGENIEPYNTILKFTGYQTAAIEIPNDTDISFPIGSRVIVRQAGDYKINVTYAAGVTGDEVRTTGYGSVIALVKESANTWFALGGIESYIPEDIVYPDANNTDDKNALTDWESSNVLPISVSNGTRTLETTDVPYGTYAARITTSNGTSGNLAEPFNTEIGESYKVSFWAKNAIDAAGRLVLWQNVVSSPDALLTGSWAYYEYVVEATGTTITPRIYIYPTSASGSILVKGLKAVKQ